VASLVYFQSRVFFHFPLSAEVFCEHHHHNGRLQASSIASGVSFADSICCELLNTTDLQRYPQASGTWLVRISIWFLHRCWESHAEPEHLPIITTERNVLCCVNILPEQQSHPVYRFNWWQCRLQPVQYVHITPLHIPSVHANTFPSWTQNPSYSSKDLNSVVPEVVHGTDDIYLFTHFFETDPAFATEIPGAPVEYGLGGAVSPGRLGIGSSSTILQRLVDVGKIAGRTYSLYIGSGMDRAGGVVNGSSVFGGYDAGRFKGPVHSQPMDLTNPDYLPVTVSNIVLTDPSNSGKNVSIMDNGQAFDARITLEQYPMSLPFQVTQNFMSILGAKTTDYPDNSVQLTKPFNGTMTITLSNGFQVTLPPHVIYNASGIAPVAFRGKTDNSPNYLSLAWLSEVYLMLDFETSQFHMAQAIAKNAYVMPTTFCPNTIPVPYDYSTKASTFVTSGLIGAVVGGVIGGSALIVLAAAIYIFWQRNKSIRDQEKRWAAEEQAWGGGKRTVEMAALSPKKKMGFHWRPKVQLARHDSNDSVDMK
jgi:hypothetical protein